MKRSHPFAILKPYLVSGLAVLSVSILKIVLFHYLKIDNALLLFFSAVTFSAWYGGFRQGVVSTALTILVVRVYFEPLATPVPAHLWIYRYILFTLDCLFISFICGQLRASRDGSKQSEGRLRKIFESNMIGLTFNDFSSNLLDVNDYFLRMLGISRKEFQEGKTNWKTISSSNQNTFEEWDPEKMAQGLYREPFEREFQRPDGTRVPVLVGASRVDKNSFVAFILDITEIKKTQLELSQAKTLLEERVTQRTQQLTEAAEQLRQSRSFLDSIIENIPNMIFVKDAKDLRFVRFNKAGENLLGRSRDDLVGKNDFDFFPNAEAEFFTAKDREVFKRKEVLDIPEEPISTANGQTKYLHTKKIPVFDKNDQPLFLMGISEDITDKKIAETQRVELIQAQAARSAAEKNAEKMAFLVEAANDASRAKSSFLANISHEIRTPLGAMLGFTELVLEDKNLAPDQLKYLSTIERNGRQLLRLVDEILDLSKVESEHIQIEKIPFDLSELVKDVIDSLALKAAEKGLELNKAVTSQVSEKINKLLVSDPSRLRQIMVNIIGNAIKFTDKGHVDVRVRLDENEDQVTGTLNIEVQDTGIGIDSKNGKYLFQPFAQADESMTRRFGGTGLGLFLSRKLAQLMGGDIVLDWSAPDQGSRFKITLAVELAAMSTRPSLRSPSMAAPVELSPEKGRVLIVDDAIDNRLLLETFLKKYGVQTQSASNGREAVEAALSSHFDVILMDVQMPVMDGFEAVKQLRSLNYQQPIIALTAHAMRGDREKCIEAGFNDYIRKPINRQLLESCLAQYVAKHSDLEN